MLEHLLCTVCGMKIKISRNLIETIQLELTNQSRKNWSFQITGRATRVNARFYEFYRQCLCLLFLSKTAVLVCLHGYRIDINLIHDTLINPTCSQTSSLYYPILRNCRQNYHYTVAWFDISGRTQQVSRPRGKKKQDYNIWILGTEVALF